MPENLSGGWILLGIAILIVGPGGAAWVGSRGATQLLRQSVDSLSREVADVKVWLKSLEQRTTETDAKVREIKAVQADRDQRGREAAD